MSGVNPVLWDGPDTVTVSVAVTGGQLVMPDTSNAGQVKPATAGAATVLGVALSDAAPKASRTNTTFSTARPEVAVAYAPVDVRVSYSSNAAFGQLLIAGASGTVTAAGATPDAATVIGRCTEPAGVTSGSVGRARLA